MGTRIQVSIHGDENTDAAGVLLYANSHHPDIDPDAIVKSIVRAHRLPTAILAELLGVRYPNATRGGHRAGDRVFHLDFEPGDAERRWAIVGPRGPRGDSWRVVPAPVVGS